MRNNTYQVLPLFLFCLPNTTHDYMPLHTWVCMSLLINDSFQNRCKTNPYQKFKLANHTWSCALAHKGVCSFLLNYFHTLNVKWLFYLLKAQTNVTFVVHNHPFYKLNIIQLQWNTNTKRKPKCSLTYLWVLHPIRMSNIRRPPNFG